MATATSVTAPPSSSLKRIWMGWVKESSTPGAWQSSAPASRRISASCVRPGRHSSARPQGDEDVRLLEAHDVGRHGRAADAGDDLRDLGHCRSSAALERSRLARPAASSRDVGRAGRLHDQVALVELGDELAAGAHEQDAADGEQRRRATDHEPGARVAPAPEAGGSRVDRADQPGLALRNVARPQQDRGRRGDERQREQQRGGQREAPPSSPSAGTSSRRRRSARGSGT